MMVEGSSLIDGHLARIALDWIAYFSSPEEGRNKDLGLHNPFGIVHEIVRCSPLYAWDLINFVLAHDKEERTLDLLAAGPLEDFVSFHGREWIRTIEEYAQEDPRFRSLLAGIWQLDTPDDVWNRIVRAQGTAEPFPSKPAGDDVS